jgi:hypothetical protein
MGWYLRMADCGAATVGGVTPSSDLKARPRSKQLSWSADRTISISRCLSVFARKEEQKRTKKLGEYERSEQEREEGEDEPVTGKVRGFSGSRLLSICATAESSRGMDRDEDEEEDEEEAEEEG